MLTLVFYVIVLWILLSFGVGVYSYVTAKTPITYDRAVSIAVNTLRLPYDVVVKLFK